MKHLLFVWIILLLSSFKSNGQQIPAYSAEDVIHHTSSKDTVYIINFWATWCAPCVGELPAFNALKRRYDRRPVRVLLVSLDFKENYPDKLALFLQRKNIMPEVAWLSDTNPNVFIPKIENSWGGSIPATIVVAPGQSFKKFIEGTITEREISKIVDGLLK